MEDVTENAPSPDGLAGTFATAPLAISLALPLPFVAIANKGFHLALSWGEQVLAISVVAVPLLLLCAMLEHTDILSRTGRLAAAAAVLVFALVAADVSQRAPLEPFEALAPFFGIDGAALVLIPLVGALRDDIGTAWRRLTRCLLRVWTVLAAFAAVSGLVGGLVYATAAVWPIPWAVRAFYLSLFTLTSAVGVPLVARYIDRHGRVSHSA